MKKIDILRKKYPKFVYKKYSYQISDKNLEIFFDFQIYGLQPSHHPPASGPLDSTSIIFEPKVVIENVKESQIKRVGKRVLDNLVFNLGLIEILSYWKATCSPEIIVNAGYLNLEQIKWWKDLIINGMGQFFYENKIDFTKPNFIKIIPINIAGARNNYVAGARDRVLVPVGGGKDSVVTLEILKRAGKKISCFSLNPTEAAQEIMRIGGFADSIIVKRKIDPKLLELNRRGFLNGHTPFSAYLAFLSVLCAVIFDYKFIAFSNERSSNEGNLKYLGKIINHQWSKSFEFEKKFRKYCRKYLTPGVKEDKSSFPPSLPLRGSSVVEYFSFLRPLYEIQIAKLFSKYPQYFNAFLSCNEAYKTYSGTKKITKKWCGNCPKCLFVFASLYPFIEKGDLIKIFGQNLFEKKELLSMMLELISLKKFKPFECVGTKKESLVTFCLSWKKYRDRVSVKLPFLLKYFEKKIMPKYQNLEVDSRKIMKSWNNQNNLPRNFEKILRRCIL